MCLKENTIAIKYPYAAAHIISHDPATIRPQSDVKLTLRCPINKNHTWKTTAGNINYERNTLGCPFCATKRPEVGINDIATTHPEIAALVADPHVAKTVSAGSGKTIAWQCSDHKEHTWETSVYKQINRGAICPICKPPFTSNGEHAVAEVVQLLRPDTPVLRSVRKILPKYYELDIYLPELHIAIEYNGIYWHSGEHVDKNYHLEKYQLAKERGIQLIQIWEDDWEHHPQRVIETLANKLHATHNLVHVPQYARPVPPTVFARKLQFRQIPSPQARELLDTHHIQGAVTATYHFGLVDPNTNDLHAVFSVRSPSNNARMRRNEGQWEIQRYATNAHTPGGFSKCLKHATQFIKERHTLTQWISFSANDISDGTMYRVNGFTPDKQVLPNYMYVGGFTNNIRVPKEHFQKSKFKANPNLKYEEGLTERELARLNHLYRIYDAGKIRWVKDVA